MTDAQQTAYLLLSCYSNLIYMPCTSYSSLDRHILREAHTTHHLIAIINVHAFDGDPQNTREIEYNLPDCLMELLPSTSTAIL